MYFSLIWGEDQRVGLSVSLSECLWPAHPGLSVAGNGPVKTNFNLSYIYLHLFDMHMRDDLFNDRKKW